MHACRDSPHSRAKGDRLKLSDRLHAKPDRGAWGEHHDDGHYTSQSICERRCRRGRCSHAWASQGAEAAAPAAKGTGVYRYKFGDVEVVQLMDGARTFPMPDQFVANVSKDQAIKAAAAAYMPEGKVTVPFSPTLINTGSKLILIDTGNGAAANAVTKGAVGQLRMNMEAAGFDPKQIDIVIISHAHLDHINGLKNADGSPAFPNAANWRSGPTTPTWRKQMRITKASSRR